MTAFAAGQHYFNRLSGGDSYFYLNADGTCFTAGKEMKMIVEGIVPKTEYGTFKSKKVASNDAERSTGLITVKSYPIISGAGYHSQPIIIIEDQNMPKDEMEIHKIQGMGLSVTRVEEDYGWLLFVDDRSLGEKYYTWMVKAVLIPWVDKLRTHRPGCEDKWFIFQIDGEAVQISCFFDEELRRLLVEKKIMVAKFSASTTEIQQPADAWKLFCAQKAVLKNLNDTIPGSMTGLKNGITSSFTAHQAKYGKLTSAKQRLGIEGVLKVYRAMEQVITKKIIKDSFAVTGITPYCIDSIMDQCFAKLKPAEELTISSSVNFLSTQIECNGELSIGDYESCGIDDNIERRRCMPPEQLVIWRRRFLILTHDKVFEREMAYRASKLQEQTDAQAKREQRVVDKAKKDEERARKGAEKADAKKRKAEERERVANANLARKRNKKQASD